MANDYHTIMICTAALKDDTNNMFRGLGYDWSPAPGATCSIALAGTLMADTPWLTTPTHWLGSAWELPTYAGLLETLKAGNIPTRDWLPFNLNQARARTAGQSLYSRTQAADGREYYVVVAENLAASLVELGLTRVPRAPTPR